MLLQAHSESLENKDDFMYDKRVIQSKLENGLTVLVCPKKDASTVSIQLWYKVGSKHEKTGERGIAHFIEHMIFKGTKNLAESDIDGLTTKLSGSCNAFTWYDYTGYLFDIPVANWDKILPIMADCMENCTFKQDHLNSELKAVIQELKMYKDSHARILKEDMITNIFESHPYHYPTIGFKQDLWSVNRDTLLAFYKKYYKPDNAVMVVVGDVDPHDVHQKMVQHFSHIPAGNGWNNEQFYAQDDIAAKSITLYRDVKQPVCTIGYVLPGVVNQNKFEMESFTYILANGRGSRLYKTLVDDLQLVVSVQAFVYDMFDKAMFFVEFNPKKETDIQRIIDIIQEHIDAIAQDGPTLQEVQRAQRFAQIEHEQMLEDTQRQAYAIGESFIATQDPYYPFHYAQIASDVLMEKIQTLARDFCPKVLRHQGQVLPIPSTELSRLDLLQKASDEEDTLMLGAKEREAPVEKPKYLHTVTLNPRNAVQYPKATSTKLANGLQCLWSANQIIDTVECQLELLAKYYYDPQDLQGLGYVVSKMMLEGTKNYPGQKFADEIESYGMSFSVSPGSIGTTMLQQDLEVGLALLTEMLTNATFTQQSLDKIKANIIEEIKHFWDTPNSSSMQLARDVVYNNHPFAQQFLGTQESIEKITLQNCIDYYHQMISPQGSRFAVVGNINALSIQAMIEKTLGQWQGSIVPKLSYPTLAPVTNHEVASYINRDQVVLVFAGLSLNRMHEDYDKVLLYEQLLTGGVLGAMSSRLFKLREQSGLFYTIRGSLVSGATEEPAMMWVKTIVSNDRIAEAEKVIAEVLNDGINSISEQELQQAKNALINSFDTLYESNESKASTFLFLTRYNLPADYFEKRAEQLQHITIEQVQEAVRKILSTDTMVKIKVGRV